MIYHIYYDPNGWKVEKEKQKAEQNCPCSSPVQTNISAIIYIMIKMGEKLKTKNKEGRKKIHTILSCFDDSVYVVHSTWWMV